MVPRLIYNDDSYVSFPRFVDRSLLLHEAPVIETLHFKLGLKSGAVDIGVWTRTAVKRVVRELIIEIECSEASSVIVPRSLYTEFSMLVSLKLSKVILVDVTCPISFPSLKKLSLVFVKYPGDGFVQTMLSNCSVLESLYVEQCPDDNVTIFTVKVPSLKSLFLERLDFADIEAGYVIDAPSLESFEILTINDRGFCIIENEMPNIVYASVDVAYSNYGNILSCITWVKRLTLCISSPENAYPVGSIFCCLVYLEILTWEKEWLNLLMRVLRDSPNLRALTLDQEHSLEDQPRPCWIEPSSVPECVITSLETFELTDYEGAEEEKEVISFILRNAKCLKKATISTECTDPNKKLKMLKELSLFTRRSPTCQLEFD
ncbi:putative FBD-associated F-box protein [Cardamine amara subsp. amara]|uniref:FBD-associated F-box protein n=1 Tax=Cardamine amara subsp. amara TaxID=228776 RepID=A0ABD0ZMG3_CARAN